MCTIETQISILKYFKWHSELLDANGSLSASITAANEEVKVILKKGSSSGKHGRYNR